jgi:hypothetical protein
MKLLKTCLTSLLITAVSGPVFAAQLVVVGVTGNAPVGLGDIVDDTKSIALAEGVTLTMINANGQKLKVTGPHKGPLGSEKTAKVTKTAAGAGAGNSGNMVEALAGLFKSQVDTKSLGAFRAAPASVPGPWMYNVASGAAYCLGKGQKPQLWRESSRKKTVVSLSAESGGKSKTLVWKKGLKTLSWPNAVPFESGASYKTKVGKKSKEQMVTVHQMPGDLPTRAHQAAWMAGKGCEAQARILIVTANVDHMIQDLEKAGQF